MKSTPSFLRSQFMLPALVQQGHSFEMQVLATDADDQDITESRGRFIVAKVSRADGISDDVELTFDTKRGAQNTWTYTVPACADMYHCPLIWPPGEYKVIFPTSFCVPGEFMQ